MLHKSFSSDETIKIGEQLGRKINNNCAVLLYGEMGAGKTRFVKGIACGLGITADITSPTFAIVNEYAGNGNNLFHFDLFRITGFDDLYAIGFFDYINRGIIVCEWSENVPDLEKEFTNFYKVEINKTGENEREINVHTRA
ncbi:MAG: tRNA (adenosine(37)-N6)-threonylcarbamoyltransferase complex ATPase subunit type 1 TsaE [Oscillospiraceae bacterium]|jgi:tRNA threonylcarbamoyladenosine biosynthesis protein TsaE|nr:tRNA (adenosine(37)-N6)-threonylcarbamoyltransferase complex ATPase subunit type 1 TsaE [Oscillospiraceae bacterium]